MSSTRYPLFLFLLTVFVFSCKDKEADTIENDNEIIQPVWEVNQVFAQMDETLDKYSLNGHSNTEAFIKMVDEIKSNETVEWVTTYDSIHAIVQMKSGLQSAYSMIAVDENGNPRTRGGGFSANEVTQLLGDDGIKIENTKILFFNAHFSSSSYASQIVQANKQKYELEVTSISGEQCNMDVVNTFPDYGLVVLNTHGQYYSFTLGDYLEVEVEDLDKNLDDFQKEVQNKPKLKKKLKVLTVQRDVGVVKNTYYERDNPVHSRGELRKKDKVCLYAKATAIAKLKLDNTIVFGNMCNSGYDRQDSLIPKGEIPILEGFRQAGTRCYYGYQMSNGYSTGVDTYSAFKMESNLFKSLLVDGKTTGEAHLSADGKEHHDTILEQAMSWSPRYEHLYFRQFFAEDYEYRPKCPDSIYDKRDKSWYQTVCIDDVVWLAENVRYNVPGSRCYGENPDNCRTYGKLYTHDQALQACPDGFRLPTESQWKALRDAHGGYAKAGGPLKADTIWLSPNEGATNSSGWGGLPGGQYDAQYNQEFRDLGKLGMWWSLTNKSNISTIFILFNDKEDARVSDNGVHSTKNYFSCRCVAK